ncbi:MAG: alpha/beta hydrolase [Planctomycetes bacterium]|nr:alpha/beta hydrolase [Planctomycetota bacterium]
MNADPARARPSKWRRRRRWLVFALLAWLLAGVVGGFKVTAPRPAVIPALAPIAGIAPVDVGLTASDGVVIRGSLFRADPDRVVVLASGIRSNRLALQARAAWYLANGCSALLLDLRGTGASDVRPISFGWHERLDLAAAAGWLRTQAFTTIGAHGLSLGAAAIVYAADIGWNFAVLEAPYDSVRQALANRLPFVPWPDLLLWPLVATAEWRADLDADRLRPLDFMPSLRCPTVLVCGDADGKVGRAATEALFAASGAGAKELVWIPDAAHVDLWPRGQQRCAAAMFRLLERLPR